MKNTKSVLVIDTPSCCGDCWLCDKDENFNCCVTNFFLDDDKIWKTRSELCPLRLMPEIDNQDCPNDDYTKGYKEGWNDMLLYLNKNSQR